MYRSNKHQGKEPLPLVYSLHKARKEVRSIELAETLECYERAVRNVAKARNWLSAVECPRTADWVHDLLALEEPGKSLDSEVRALREVTAVSPFLE